MNLFLEPLMTGLPKLSCYHRAYFDKQDVLVIDLGTTLIPLSRSQIPFDIISGTVGIKPEVTFRVYEDIDSENPSSSTTRATVTLGNKVVNLSPNRLEGKSTRVTDADLNEVRFLILECFNWKSTHHVTPWK